VILSQRHDIDVALNQSNQSFPTTFVNFWKVDLASLNINLPNASLKPPPTPFVQFLKQAPASHPHSLASQPHSPPPPSSFSSSSAAAQQLVSAHSSTTPNGSHKSNTSHRAQVRRKSTSKYCKRTPRPQCACGRSTPRGNLRRHRSRRTLVRVRSGSDGLLGRGGRLA
jgi:hypothetical protein